MTLLTDPSSSPRQPDCLDHPSPLLSPLFPPLFSLSLPSSAARNLALFAMPSFSNFRKRASASLDAYTASAAGPLPPVRFHSSLSLSDLPPFTISSTD